MLAEGVGEELAPEGIDLLVCRPAVVRTPHFLSDGHVGDWRVPMSFDPTIVARQAVATFGRRRVFVPGTMGKVARFMMGRLIPRGAAAAMMGRSPRATDGEAAR